jgi:hypothetical protein
MGDVSSGTEVWLRCGQVLCGPAKYAARLFVLITLAAAVLLAATLLPAPATDIHGQTTAEHATYDAYDTAPCDEGFVCSSFVFLQGLEESFSEAGYRVRLISLEIPLRNLSTPMVDLPPPRAAV